MPLTSDDWADAFAKQALSDWGIYQLLSHQEPPVDACHWLHYLQMATEKAGKAYQMRAAKEPEKYAKSHIAFEKGLSTFLNGPGKDQLAQVKGQARVNQLQKYRGLAKAVENLAPANDRENTPENAEYPWKRRDSNGNESLETPCEHLFDIESTLQKAPDFLKILAQFVNRA